jgi:hypothetical protein
MTVQPNVLEPFAQASQAATGRINSMTNLFGTMGELYYKGKLNKREEEEHSVKYDKTIDSDGDGKPDMSQAEWEQQRTRDVATGMDALNVPVTLTGADGKPTTIDMTGTQLSLVSSALASVSLINQRNSNTVLSNVGASVRNGAPSSGGGAPGAPGTATVEIDDAALGSLMPGEHDAADSVLRQHSVKSPIFEALLRIGGAVLGASEAAPVYRTPGIDQGPRRPGESYMDYLVRTGRALQ